MSWRVDLSKTAEKQFNRLDKPIKQAAEALFNRLESLQDIRSIGHALTGPLSGYWTYVIHGDWRAVADFENKALIVKILKIAARDKVYK